MAKNYILSDITPKIGSMNQSYIYDLTWVDPEDLTVYMMVVDESYRNYGRWSNIIKNNILGVYTGLKRTSKLDKNGQPVMSADSHPQLITALSETMIMDVITLAQTQ